MKPTRSYQSFPLKAFAASLFVTIGVAATVAPSFADAPSGGATVHDAQNPVANIIALPIQNNTYFDSGPYKRTANTLLLQPVYPFKLSEDWNLITRTIIPVISQPRLSLQTGGKSGLGDIQSQLFLSPAHPGEIIWGIGPQLLLPTATDKRLGANRLGGGISAVALTIQNPWLFGALVNNLWAGSGQRRVNELTINPFAFYNFPNGWYLFSSPVITANWADAVQNKRWTVPLGGGLGPLFKIANQAINARFQFFDNVERPTYAPHYQMQLQIQFLFPK